MNNMKSKLKHLMSPKDNNLKLPPKKPFILSINSGRYSKRFLSSKRSSDNSDDNKENKKLDKNNNQKSKKDKSL